MPTLRPLIDNLLTYTGKCFHHCENPTTMRILHEADGKIVAAYSCPDGLVSQVVYFTDSKPELEWFREFLSQQVGKRQVSRRDIRLASRYGWELGGKARQMIASQLGPERKLTEVYWTRYPKTTEQKKITISLCIGDSSKPGCLKLFNHDRKSNPILCRKCKPNNKR
ncbi:MAG TPA: hypothetical protein VEH56_07940 [Candidatus Saccharimonadales bacterium]|nr:hypothetical protein [Candidatus Saccharimonadales bacterium]